MASCVPAKQKEWVREKATLAEFTPRENQDWPETTPFYAIRMKCKEVADNEIFENIVVLAILVNVCVLAMDHYPMSDWAGDLYTTTNTCFLVFFTFEIAVNFGQLIAVNPQVVVCFAVRLVVTTDQCKCKKGTARSVFCHE